MDALVARLLAAVSATTASGVAGGLVGAVWQMPYRGALAGVLFAAATAVAVDALRAHRLLKWLRGPMEVAAPRDTGFWGELGYRIERTLRLRDQALLREQDRLEQFLSAIEASPNGVLMLDARGHIEWCNSVAADHLDLDPVRDRGQTVTNLLRAPAFVEHLQGEPTNEPVQFSTPGRPGMLSVLVRAYGDGQRLVLSQDVTERLRSDGMRRDFVANVSHEIRTPLTVLAGFVETLSSLPLTEVERRRVLTLMTQQTDRMQALVADLLTLAQLEGGPRPPADRWVSVSALLQRTAGDAHSLSGGRHVFTVDEGGDAQLAGNENELLSALGNLVSNAIRYTPAGERIAIAWQERPDGSCMLEVSDSGPGIAREHLSRLTERFYRVDGSRSRDTGGTGLGLSIVKHVVQRHGGDLEIESDIGRGSRFRLVFPAARVRHARQADQRAAVSAG